MHQQDRPSLGARSEGCLHRLEQTATAQGAQLQLGTLKSIHLLAGEGHQTTGSHRALQRFIEKHIHVVALAREHRIRNQQAHRKFGLTATQQALLANHGLGIDATTAAAENQLLLGFEPVANGALLTAPRDLELDGAAAIAQGLARGELPAGIGKLLLQAAAPQLHQGQIEARTALQQGR